MRQSFLSRKSGLNAKDETRSLFMCLYVCSGSFLFVHVQFLCASLQQVDDYHGTKISDPYAWLEDPDGAETMVHDDFYLFIFEECYCWFFTQKNHLHFIPCHVVFVTQAFVEEQNKLTMPYLEQCAIRAQFHQRLTEVYNYPKYSCPYKRGKR